MSISSASFLFCSDVILHHSVAPQIAISSQYSIFIFPHNFYQGYEPGIHIIQHMISSFQSEITAARELCIEIQNILLYLRIMISGDVQNTGEYAYCLILKFKLPSPN